MKYFLDLKVELLSDARIEAGNTVVVEIDRPPGLLAPEYYPLVRVVKHVLRDFSHTCPVSDVRGLHALLP